MNPSKFKFSIEEYEIPAIPVDFFNLRKSRDIQGLKKLMMKLQFMEYGLKKIFRRFTAYIQQNDVFVGTLTVGEHLFLQSKISKESSQRQADRVQEVVQFMGFQKCYKNFIGTPDLSNTISGDEMKRLVFASEILTDPSIIFTDKPTSGLDSYLAIAVVNKDKNDSYLH